jgi:hypothetical protein
MLALFGETAAPPRRQLAGEQNQALRGLWLRREQLIEMLIDPRSRAARGRRLG